MARLSTTARYDSGCWPSTTVDAPPEVMPSAKVAPTITKKATARPLRPSQRCPRPGTSHARKQGTAAPTRGRVRVSAGASRTVSFIVPAPLFLDDPDADLPGHLGVQLHGEGVDAERLDRLLDEDAPLVDHDAVLLEILGDVRGGHRPVQLIVLPHLADDGARQPREAASHRGGVFLLLGQVNGVLAPPLLDRLEVALGRRQGLALGQQEVAGIPGGHVHDLAAASQLVDVVPEHDAHASLPGLPRLIRSERQKREAAGPLDGDHDLALVLGAGAR